MSRIAIIASLLGLSTLWSLARGSVNAVNATPAMETVATRTASLLPDLSAGPGGTLVIVILTVAAVIVIRRFGALE